MFSIPVLMLHYVGSYNDPTGKLMAISTSQFDALLDIVVNKGYHTITFEDLAVDNLKSRDLCKAVILTFDDCAKGLFDYAIPALLKRNMKACFFVPTSHIGSYNNWDHDDFGSPKLPIMSEQDLLQLKTWGMEIGSHAHQHLHLNKLTEMDCLYQMQTSKQKLEELLQKTIHTFSWPYGEVPPRYQYLMRKAGYIFGLCIYRPFQNSYTLRRIGIHEKDTKKSIEKKLTKRYLWQRSLLDIWLCIKPLRKN